jgi:hypothetical protein
MLAIFFRQFLNDTAISSLKVYVKIVQNRKTKTKTKTKTKNKKTTQK